MENERVYRSYTDLWHDLRAWAQRELKLLENSKNRNRSQEAPLKALLHRMDLAEIGDSNAFGSIRAEPNYITGYRHDEPT